MIQLTNLLFLSTLALANGAHAEKHKLRVGHFPNLTHAQGVIGHGLSRAQPRGERKRAAWDPP